MAWPSPIANVIGWIRSRDLSSGASIVVNLLGLLALVSIALIAKGLTVKHSGADAWIWTGGFLLIASITGILAVVPALNPDTEVPMRLANNTTLAIMAGLLLVVVHASDVTSYLLWSCACLMLGGMVGFLFGAPATDGNSQLHQVADWLTKIVVGLGLTQLTRIPPMLRDWADYVANGTQSDPTKKISSTFALAIIMYFTVVGFMAGYLLMKVFLNKYLGPTLDEPNPPAPAHPPVPPPAPAPTTPVHTHTRHDDASPAAVARSI